MKLNSRINYELVRYFTISRYIIFKALLKHMINEKTGLINEI